MCRGFAASAKSYDRTQARLGARKRLDLECYQYLNLKKGEAGACPRIGYLHSTQKETCPRCPQRPICWLRMTRSRRTHGNTSGSWASWPIRAVTPRTQLFWTSCRRRFLHWDRMTTLVERETTAFAKARHVSLEGAGATACIPARPTDSLRAIPATAFVGVGRRFVGIDEPVAVKCPGCDDASIDMGHPTRTHQSQSRSAAGEPAPDASPRESLACSSDLGFLANLKAEHEYCLLPVFSASEIVLAQLAPAVVPAPAI